MLKYVVSDLPPVDLDQVRDFCKKYMTWKKKTDTGRLELYEDFSKMRVNRRLMPSPVTEMVS